MKQTVRLIVLAATAFGMLAVAAANPFGFVGTTLLIAGLGLAGNSIAILMEEDK